MVIFLLLLSHSLPEKEDLQILCESYMSAIIKLSLPNNSVWAVKGKLSKLVHTIISIFDEVRFNIRFV